MTLRPGTLDDANVLPEIHRLAAFRPPLHTADEEEAFVRQLIAENQVWVVEVGDEVVAYVAFDNDWLRHLFVHPKHQGRGYGSALLTHALTDRRERQLWTFEKNALARKFYEDHGWVLVELTDGRGNEWNEPEVRYAWKP